jgi:ADP-heptose:LPS heptosyltransferase
MKKAKVFGSPLSFLSSMLPGSARLSLLSWLVQRRYDAPGIVFPFGFSTPPKILVLLPEDPLAALHQVSGLVALAARFRDARITVLCQRLVTPFFRMLTAVNDFIEYDCRQRYLFSKDFTRIGKAINNERYDMCVMLDNDPPMALLYLCGQSAAAVRIGFAETGGVGSGYPFLNMQVKPSQRCAYSTDRGLLLASMLGAQVQTKMRWSVAKDSIAEVNLLLGEMKIDPSSRLVGIDAGYFLRVFGAQWTQSLIEKLQDLWRDKSSSVPATTRWTCYLFSYEEPDEKTSEWLGRHGLPVFSNLTASRCAALVNKSGFVVAGATVLFELADVLRRPVIGILTDSQFDAYCRESETTRGLRYSKRPDQSTIDTVGNYFTASTARSAFVP